MGWLFDSKEEKVRKHVAHEAMLARKAAARIEEEAERQRAWQRRLAALRSVASDPEKLARWMAAMEDKDVELARDVSKAQRDADDASHTAWIGVAT